ncbi:10623_t:CDS:2 [Funneliformis mosseae]|uniref:10623_t:CDS:1 n=1 Tax=Funneliformis mosseae TaxID=27381 RepID=A0A9N9GT49_FUNMO|nr:10623_t:CDS:2 [Funneliformis mosseae]
MTKIRELREKQSNFLRSCSSPCPLDFFKRFNFRSKSSANNNYKVGLKKRCERNLLPENLLEMKRKFDNNDLKTIDAQFVDDLDGGVNRTDENLISNTDNKENEDGSSNNNIDGEGKM